MSTGDQPIRQSQPKVDRIGPWLEIETLLVVASFFAYSYLTGRVSNFLSWRYIWLTPMAATALYAMGVTRLVAHFRGYRSGELEEASAWQVPVSACVVVLIAPVVLALIVDPQQLTPEGARKRSIPPPPHNMQLADAFDWALGLKTDEGEGAGQSYTLPEEPTILDVIDAVRQGYQRDLEGQTITLVGQCDVPDGPRSKRFYIYRLVVTCCIADATTVMLEVDRRATIDLEPGGWVRIKGVIKFDSQSDPSQPVIDAKMTTKIQEPGEPYL